MAVKSTDKSSKGFGNNKILDGRLLDFYKTSRTGGGTNYIPPPYQISRSLRFNSSDSAYLSRTPASAGNRKTFTFSCWIKRSKAGDFRTIFSAATDTSNLFIIRFTDTDLLEIRSATSGSTVFQLITTQVFRDFSAWYHIVVAVDTTNATGGDRVRLYINGSEVTVFNTDTVPTQNADSWVNNNVLHEICRQANNASNYYQDGYLADVHLIEGQQLTPSSFGEFDANGVWQPIAYTGTYGTNGFHLPFSDNSTAAALGTDTSGNSNTWTVNNISVAAGADNDSLVDTPTSYGTDTGAGGEVRGNYCTFNPLFKLGGTAAGTWARNGNLEAKTDVNASLVIFGTVGMPSGSKFYTEFTMVDIAESNDHVGIVADIQASADAGTCIAYKASGEKIVNGTVSSYGASYTDGDVIGIAVNLVDNEVTFYKNGASQGTITGITSGTYFHRVRFNNVASVDGDVTANWGQRPFAYTAPSGFKALCDTNLPTPTIADGSTVMDVVTYTGNNSTQSITGLAFSPDLVWVKGRNDGTYYHRLTSTGLTQPNYLAPNATDAEGSLNNTISSLDANGFTVDGTGTGGTNESGINYVGWAWDAGSSTVTNTDGTITSSVRANASAGFSIVTYTGNGTNGATVGHGLGVHADLIIVKNRSAVSDWPVSLFTSRETGMAWSHVMFLNKTDAQTDSPAGGKIRSGSSNTTTFECVTGSSNAVDVNTLNNNYVAYCFAPVAGYSSFGSYTGNGSTDGPFVYTGFRPRWVLWKNSSNATGYNWYILDSQRSSINVAASTLAPNTASDEDSAWGADGIMDFTSNGFKIRRGAFADTNNSGDTYIYAAFAENPFQYARGR